MRGRRGLVVAVAVVALLGAGCSGDDADEGAADGGAPAGATTAAPAGTTVGERVELTPLQAADGRIVDAEGRDVLLRGVNVTSLGEYWQGDADHPPTQPMTDADWDEMAAHGFSVVRLVITWSRVEPVRGEIDQAYLDEVEAYVDAAAERGIFTVIDMHQDAYSAFIATEDAGECEPGTEPGKGWDGAPEWAVITDGASTCITGDRNSAPAVVNAWNHFYDDTDGIRTRFTAAWAAVATRFAGRPEVAGYDLLNEPEVSRPGAELEARYDALIGETVTAIRDAEAAAGADFEHLVFVEPAIPAGDVTFGIVIPDPERIGVPASNVVAAPHNYAESIQQGPTVEATNELYVSVADGLGVPTWIGEYGWWDTSDESLEEATRMAADLDARGLGGAWWQWRQPCGDPHSIPWGGWGATEPGSEVVTHLHRLGCPGDVDLGPTEELLAIVGRGYPRATPGRLDELTSDPATGAMALRASGAEPGQVLIAWTPTTEADAALVHDGLVDVEAHAVPGGRLVTATVDRADYSFEVEPTGDGG